MRGVEMALRAFLELRDTHRCRHPGLARRRRNMWAMWMILRSLVARRRGPEVAAFAALMRRAAGKGWL